MPPSIPYKPLTPETLALDLVSAAIIASVAGFITWQVTRDSFKAWRSTGIAFATALGLAFTIDINT